MSGEGTNATLHPAEHRGYRELYLSSRHLIKRWGRLISALEGTAYAEVLERGRDRVEKLLAALPTETERYGVYGGPIALGVGARMADLRGAFTDRSVDTGMVMRLAVLDIEHVATLLGQLGALARSRGDDELAAFCREWESSIRPEVETTRVAAISVGDSPELAAAPLDSSLLGRAAHGVGWMLGSVGETVDRVSGQRRGSQDR
ncbi:MAG TPA: hypothetical protein VHH72_07670 [Solirubrobacterales bacterium]|jgi:hypothetical protein|nr:hypothetical protein [Solirubrobacterales bacterium]